jgi:hypothetical protein
VKGILRPCRHQLDGPLREQWRAHLCGLCLTLRDEAGQSARVLTGYDVLLLSVLVEAQAGACRRSQAGACPLRGMRPASVVSSDTPAMQLSAAGALLAGSAGLVDKVADHDLPRVLGPVAQRAAGRLQRTGERLAGTVQLPADAMTSATRAAAATETRHDATLAELLAPTGAAVAQLFAHTATVAGRPENADALRRAGDAFGRLVHLADARSDLRADVAHDAFNPLVATRTSPETAYALARSLQQTVTAAVDELSLVDPRLLRTMLGPVLDRAVRRLAPAAPSAAGAAGQVAVLGAAAMAAGILGVFGGGPWRRRRGPFGGGYGPGYDPSYGYGYRRGGMRGPGCLDLLACDCCANLACDEICGGDDCCVCCI